MDLPTVEIVNEKAKSGFTRINEADFDPNIHVRRVDPMDHDANGEKGGAARTDGPTVAEFVAAGYPAKNYPPAGYASKSTPEEIAAAIAAQDAQANAQNGSGGSDGGSSGGDDKKAPVVIPDDWKDAHHFAKIALAEQIAGKDIEATADKTKTEVAVEIIAAEVAKRAAA